MKTIIITGAANGVGKEIAKMLAGNTLILIDEDKNNLEKLAEALKTDFFVCDVSNVADLEKTIETILVKHKKIDCLVNNAGMWVSGDISKINLPEYKDMNKLDRVKKVIDTNVFGVIGMVASVYPIMEKQGGGQIININSQSGVEIEPPFPIYNATKTSSYTFRKAIQFDLAKHNIKITDICPGLIKTDFYKRANAELPKTIMDTGLEPIEVARAVKYVLELPHEITIPSLEIRHIKNY